MGDLWAAYKLMVIITNVSGTRDKLKYACNFQMEVVGGLCLFLSFQLLCYQHQFSLVLFPCGAQARLHHFLSVQQPTLDLVISCSNVTSSPLLLASSSGELWLENHSSLLCFFSHFPHSLTPLHMSINNHIFSFSDVRYGERTSLLWFNQKQEREDLWMLTVPTFIKRV